MFDGAPVSPREVLKNEHLKLQKESQTCAAGFERSWFSAQRNRHAALDEGVAHRVWEGVRDHVPARLRGWRAARCNELLRTYRYEPGESFAKHEDDSSVVKGETSLLTVLVYLNDGFRGGATRLCKYRATDEGRSTSRRCAARPSYSSIRSCMRA